MLIEEARKLLKKTEIDSLQLDGINSLYILLDLDKEDFCKILDTVGLDKLLVKQNYYDRLLRAEQELRAQERYLISKARLEELELEMNELHAIVNDYALSITDFMNS